MSAGEEGRRGVPLSDRQRLNWLRLILGVFVTAAALQLVGKPQPWPRRSGRGAFLAAGGTHFAALPCLNDSDEGMEMLQILLRESLAGWVGAD